MNVGRATALTLITSSGRGCAPMRFISSGMHAWLPGLSLAHGQIHIDRLAASPVQVSGRPGGGALVAAAVAAVARGRLLGPPRAGRPCGPLHGRPGACRPAERYLTPSAGIGMSRKFYFQ